MVRITIEGEELDLNEGFTLSIEETSPIFSDAGSQAIDITIPATAKNKRLLGFPQRPDNTGDIPTGRIPCQVLAGAYIRTGELYIGEAGDTGISINIGLGNSVAYDTWKAKQLKDIDSLPAYRYRNMAAVKEHIMRLYAGARPKEDDLAVFPIALAKKTWKNGDDEYELHDTLNAFGTFTIFSAVEGRTWQSSRIIDGKNFIMNWPDGYMCSPFVRVWKILECVFGDLGLEMDRNPFREDAGLARLVVLNNTEDTLCGKTLDYAELMPDCTVEEFMEALRVRFGLVFTTDFDTGTAHVRLLRDINALSVGMELTQHTEGKPTSEYRTPKYVALSADTSIEGAETGTDRFEDFIGDYDLNDVWQVGDSMRNSEQFDSEINRRIDEIERKKTGPDEETDTYIFPDGVDRIAIIRTPAKATPKEYVFSRAATSGTWERHSKRYGKISAEASSSFFQWDPQPEGLEKEELSSTDRCCPVRRAGMARLLIPDWFEEANDITYEYMPTFLAAPRHFRTSKYSGEEETEGECPLSFMFAFTRTALSENTVGRNSPDVGEGEAGLTIWGPANESQHPYSLYFQFRNGLYSMFWRKYDMMMRRKDRSVKVSARLKSIVARGINVLEPIKLHGIPMLIEEMDITLGDGDKADVDFTLSPIVPLADLTNPEIPDFP